MKKLNIMRLLLLWGLGGILFLSSCFKEQDMLWGGTVTKDVTLKNLKLLYKGEDVVLTQNLAGPVPLGGTVISDTENGNIEPGKIVIVQTKQNQTAGIILSLNTTLPISYRPGDSIVADILGATLKRVDGRLEITGLGEEKITKVDEDKTVKPEVITLNELEKDFNDYESMLVTLPGTDMILPTGGDGKYAGLKDMYDGTNPEGTIKLNTLATASFAQQTVPANANFTGIAVAGTGSEKYTLRLRSLNDVTISSSSLDANTDLIISGFMTDPAGTDSPGIGVISSYPNGVSVTHAGSYEYIQLMALRDIDFSITPYSVVVASNDANTTVGTKGWAEGGTRTFKFNITSGTVKAGEFCYVGGPAKVIAGYWNCGLTNSISSANWVRTIRMPAVGGDGFGSASFTLPNIGNDGTNIADGIAVFKGTAVTEISVPIDAIFYGTRIGAAYNETSMLGYRVPMNDHYNPINPNTGEAQPYFGQGTNTYTYSQPTGDASDYSKLGGIVSKKTWVSPRKRTAMVMYSATCSEAQVYTLQSLESGTGVTVYRK